MKIKELISKLQKIEKTESGEVSFKYSSPHSIQVHPFGKSIICFTIIFYLLYYPIKYSHHLLLISLCSRKPCSLTLHLILFHKQIYLVVLQIRPIRVFSYYPFCSLARSLARLLVFLGQFKTCIKSALSKAHKFTTYNSSVSALRGFCITHLYKVDISYIKHLAQILIDHDGPCLQHIAPLSRFQGP